MDDLDAATLDDVRDFFRTWYVPNNAVLTSPATSTRPRRRSCRNWFGEIPAVRLPPRPVATVPPADGEKRIVVEDQVRLPKLFRLSLPGVGTGFHASDLVATMLAVGRSSRLDAALVRDRSLARDVSAFILPLELCGQLHVQATCREGVAPEQLEKAIDEEIARFVAVGPDEDELDRAKTRLETDLARQLDSLGDRADRFSDFHTLHGDPRLVAGEFGRTAAVTTGEIRELAARILVPANRATAWYLPKNGTANPGAD